MMRRRRLAVSALAAVVGAAFLVPTAVDRADGAAVLVVVEDALPSTAPGATLRRDERRADSLLLLQWDSGCDELTVTSVPRDLVLVPGDNTLSVLLETDGLDRIVDLLGAAFDVRIAATVMLDIGDIEAVAARLGPIAIDLPAAGRDQRTGFMGGPGRVMLDPRRLVAYLRARNWEQMWAGEWRVISRSDEDRIVRLQRFLRAALVQLRDESLAERVVLAGELGRRGGTHIIDPLAVAGWAVGAASVRATTFTTVPVLDERSIDERRSPFAPADLEAAPRLVLAPSAPASAVVGCEATS